MSHLRHTGMAVQNVPQQKQEELLQGNPKATTLSKPNILVKNY